MIAGSPASRLSLTVVVAAWPDHAGTAETLRALASQLDDETELLVVGNSAAPVELVAQFPKAEWIQSNHRDLIPHLWASGIRQAQGSCVAITTNHFVPAPDWLAQLRAALDRQPASEIFGVGGLIDPPTGYSLANWATYFLRYSSQFRFRGETRVADTAGDNVAYRTPALRGEESSFAHGFWEPEFHRALVRQGASLMLVPSVRVRQHRCFGVRGFCRQRYEHGQHYGQDRLRSRPSWHRFAAVALSPLIPIILLAKVSRNVLHRPALAPMFLLSSPVLALFVLSWAAGETMGYVTLSSHNSSRESVAQ
jgi:GT2 family glycosyltransferase